MSNLCRLILENVLLSHLLPQLSYIDVQENYTVLSEGQCENQR